MRLTSLNIKGYRAFRDFTADLGPLTVIVGANGTGKSCLLDFLRFLRDSMSEEIGPKTLPTASGQQVFHIPGPEHMKWRLNVEVPIGDAELETPLKYSGALDGPLGNIRVVDERLVPDRGLSFGNILPGELVDWFLQRDMPKEAQYRDPFVDGLQTQSVTLRQDELVLRVFRSGPAKVMSRIAEFFSSLEVFMAFGVAREALRQPVTVTQNPSLADDASNLCAVLDFMQSEHRGVFDELQVHLRTAIPGFPGLIVRAFGGQGQKQAFWGMGDPKKREALSLADLSDGILQLLVWMVACLQPNKPSLMCFDEPELGLHPRALPILAALLQSASDETQVIVTTHSSYLLSQFPIEDVAVTYRDGDNIGWSRPGTSEALVETLKDFGDEELAALHLSDGLEAYS